MADEEALRKALEEFNTVAKPKETLETSEAAAIVTAKTMKIDVEGFSFEVTTRLLPRHMRLITQSANVDKVDFDYDKTMEPMAEFMEGVSVDKQFTKEFWLQYNEDTGYLPDLVAYIVENSQNVKPKIERFR